MGMIKLLNESQVKWIFKIKSEWRLIDNGSPTSLHSGESRERPFMTA